MPSCSRLLVAPSTDATGVGADAISPRALTRLPQSLLQELASLLMLAEDTGDWSTAISLVLIVLLPKEEGGYRPIGLFPTLIRVWMRARAAVARDWEELTASPSQYGSKGMGAQRAAWTTAFSAETAMASGNDHAAVLLDLVKAFEMVNHSELVRAAKEHGFSLKVLRLSLAAYRLARSVGIDDVYSNTVQATRGITAGSGFATTELRLLLVDLMYDLRRLWPVEVKLYVDDLTIAAKGRKHQVVEQLTAATDHAISKFTRLGLEVSKSKSAALASRSGIRKALVIKNHAKVLRGARTAKLLGADFTGSRRRSTHVQVKRINGFAAKIGRIRAIRQQGLSAVQYVQAAGIPAMMYGVDCAGISDTNLKKANGLAAAAIAPPALGKNARMTLHAAAPVCTSVDPSYAAHVSPIKTWATAWWDGWMDSTAMRMAYKSAASNLKEAKSSAWSRVHGPAAALVATCKRIGWRSSDGRTFKDDVGATHDVALDPPTSIAAAAQRSVRRWCLRQVFAELPPAAPVGNASTRQPTTDVPPSRTLIDVSHALKPLYKGGKSVADNYPQWRAKHRADLSSAISGGQWPQARKARLPRWQHGNLCQLCKNHVGTIAHRRVCPEVVPPEGWPAASPDVERFVSSLTPARQQILADRAVVAIDIPTPTPQAESGRWHWTLRPPDLYDETYRWYIDGSRRHPRHHELAVTGCGVAVVDSLGRLVGLANATPPSWVASSAAAEAWALYLTLQEVAVLPVIITDCLGLLSTADAGVEAATSPKAANARIWRLICELLDGRIAQLRRALIWMPAHTSVDQCRHRQRSDLKQVTTVDWRANQLADALAKEAALDDPRRRAAARYISNAEKALLHHAVLVGLATHEANNHRVVQVCSGGMQKEVLLRDSTSLPAGARRAQKLPAGIKRKRKTAAADYDETAATLASCPLPDGALAPTRSAERASCKRACTAAAKKADGRILADLVSQNACRLRPPASATSSAERLSALRERIRMRESAAG